MLNGAEMVTTVISKATDHRLPLTNVPKVLKYGHKCQDVTEAHRVSKSYWKNVTSGVAGRRVANLLFV